MTACGLTFKSSKRAQAMAARCCLSQLLSCIVETHMFAKYSSQLIGRVFVFTKTLMLGIKYRDFTNPLSNWVSDNPNARLKERAQVRPFRYRKRIFAIGTT